MLAGEIGQIVLAPAVSFQQLAGRVSTSRLVVMCMWRVSGSCDRGLAARYLASVLT
jgi:hypothetical protein